MGKGAVLRDKFWETNPPVDRSLVYVEGDATMSVYRDAEGKTKSSLNVVQRRFCYALVGAGS
jgi:hypothetical protein